MIAEALVYDLAIAGGSPTRARPLPPWPHFDEDAIAAAVEVLRTGRVNYWTGEHCRAFEAEFARLCACEHAIAVSNGTVALELAIEALGIGAGDEVVVPARTFVATASAVVRCGARPVFADVDPESGNVSAATLEAAIGPRTRALVVVHLAGWPCAMDEIVALARRHDLRVVEDCAQAHGAGFDGRPVGSFGDVAAFSFCQDKIMTTAGEGGMIVTSDRGVWERAWSLKDHGKNPSSLHEARIPGGFRWVHESFGTNARMTELQAAVGRVALRELPAWVARRREHAGRMTEALDGLGALTVARPGPRAAHAYYRLYGSIDPARLRDGWDRDRVIAAINAEGVPCAGGVCPEIYRERAVPEDWRPTRRLPHAERLGARSLALPVHPTLESTDVDDVIAAVAKVVEVASR